MTTALWGLLAAVSLASFVEMVEAATIVLAMGFTRNWRSTLLGVAAALVALAAFTVAAGYALANWLPQAALQLVIGTLLLIFGLQWLRKAVLRSSGLKALHDESEEFAEQAATGRQAGAVDPKAFDLFGFMVSFKGVFLEGVEVVFIVVTFGLNADNVPVAALGAAVAAVVVLGVVAVARRPLAMIPENTLKYVVGLLLAAFGSFWAVEGLGIFTDSRESLPWPGSDWAIFALLAAWFLLSRLLIIRLRRPAGISADEGGPR